MRAAKWVALKAETYFKLEGLKRRLRARSFNEVVDKLIEDYLDEAPLLANPLEEEA